MLFSYFTLTPFVKQQKVHPCCKKTTEAVLTGWLDKPTKVMQLKKKWICWQPVMAWLDHICSGKILSRCCQLQRLQQHCVHSATSTSNNCCSTLYSMLLVNLGLMIKRWLDQLPVGSLSSGYYVESWIGDSLWTDKPSGHTGMGYNQHQSQLSLPSFQGR